MAGRIGEWRMENGELLRDGSSFSILHSLFPIPLSPFIKGMHPVYSHS
jgi:hypothetical protein